MTTGTPLSTNRSSLKTSSTPHNAPWSTPQPGPALPSSALRTLLQSPRRRVQRPRSSHLPVQASRHRMRPARTLRPRPPSRSRARPRPTRTGSRPTGSDPSRAEPPHCSVRTSGLRPERRSAQDQAGKAPRPVPRREDQPRRLRRRGTRLTAQIHELDTADTDQRAAERSELAQRFDEVAELLACIDIHTVWDEADDRERRVLIEDLLDAVYVYPDHLRAVTCGAPPLEVELTEVGPRPRQDRTVRVGGPT